MTIEELIAERDIQRQLARFARAMDARDWTTIASLMSEGITADLGTGEIQGSKAIIDLMRSYLDNCGVTQHLLGNIIIDIYGDNATSQSYVSDMHLSRDPEQDIRFYTLGNYSDKWIRVDDTWLLDERLKNNRATVGSMSVFKPRATSE